MVSTVLKKCSVVIVILTCCRASPEKESDNHIRELYNALQKAINDTHNNTNAHSISRRVFVHESEYQIHINKLKEVNGFKMHNIVIELPETNSTIYFNNPLESKLPHPFMSLNEFKNAIIEQRVKDRDKFEKSKLENENNLSPAKRKSTTKFKFTPRKKVLRARNVTTTSKKITTKARPTATTSIKERTNERKVNNESKTITTKVSKQSTEIKLNTQTSKTGSVEKRTTPKNVPSRSIDVQEKSSYRTVSSSTAFVDTNKTSDSNKDSKKLKLNVKELTVNKSLVSGITAETKVTVNSLVAAKVNANTTKTSTPKLKNNTVSSENNESVNNAISNIMQKAKLNVTERTVNESLISVITAETKVTVNYLVAAKVIANKTNNTTVSLENSLNVNDTISNISQAAASATLDKVVPTPIDKELVDKLKIETKTSSTDKFKFVGQGRTQSINTDDEEETAILKEIAIANATNIKVTQQENNTVSLEKSENVNDFITVDENKEGNLDKERASFENEQFVVDGKQAVNNVYDEEINVFDETNTEPTTTTTTRVKWSRPKVFMGQQPNEESEE